MGEVSEVRGSVRKRKRRESSKEVRSNKMARGEMIISGPKRKTNETGWSDRWL